MATVARTSAFPNSTLTRGIHTIIGFNFTSREPVCEKLANVRDSTAVREQELTMGGAGLFWEKDEGTEIDYTSFNEGFLKNYTYVEYARGFRITRRMYINDLYQTMEQHPAELGRMAMATRETVAAGPFNNGFATETTADGQTVFAITHVREDGVVYRNEFASGSEADLSRTSLEAGLIDFRDFRSGGSLRLQLEPKTLLTADNSIFEGWRILESTHEPETDVNAINPVSQMGLAHQTWSYLTDSDAWFLLAAKGTHSYNIFDRENFWSDHIIDFDTMDVKYSGLMAFSVGVTDPRGVFGSPGI